MKGGASEVNLIFDWPRREGFSFVLFGCIAGSLLAHAATFFLFQVVNPQRATIPPPPPQVSLLRPSSPENIALLHWLDAEDPALAASATSIIPAGLPEVPYRPSFAVSRTPLLVTSTDQPEPVRFPPAQDPLAIINAAKVSPPLPAPAGPAQRTRITVSGALAPRALTRNPPLAFAVRSSVPIETAQWLLGVNDRGEIRYTFLQKTSGNPALDELAAAHFRNLSFAVSDTPVAWGFATIAWGDEAYGTDASPAAVPTLPAP